MWAYVALAASWLVRNVGILRIFLRDETWQRPGSGFSVLQPLCLRGLSIAADGALREAVHLDEVVVSQQEHHHEERIGHSVHIQSSYHDVATAVDRRSQTVTEHLSVATFDFRARIEAEEVHLVDQGDAWFGKKLVEVVEKRIFHAA